MKDNAKKKTKNVKLLVLGCIWIRMLKDFSSSTGK